MKRAKFNLKLYKNYRFLFLPKLVYNKLLWKDKFNSPRCELEPSFKFEFLWFGIYGIWGDDDYWEHWLWVNKYHNGDIIKAKNEWGWIDYKTQKSTWNDDYFKK